jgi:hypothetical protein
MDYFDNFYFLDKIQFDLIGVAIAVLGILVLSAIVFFRSKRSITSRTFFFFSFVTIFWGVSNYFLYKFSDPENSLLALRFHIFITILHAYAFFQLAHICAKLEEFSFQMERHTLIGRMHTHAIS